ncbi:MAG TPA: cbb3-type cytochrome c oxidase subunit II [Candidatus Acidoferrum sp.]|nr:cbb3-type cytochrome c oxidase subunit II [Candidatus Acidoferrum sp.]
MNYGPLLFLAAFFALASSWCGFVLAPQLQVGRLQQTNTLSGGATYPVARSGLAQQGLQVYRANGCAACHSQQVRQSGTVCDVMLTEAGTNELAVISALLRLKCGSPLTETERQAVSTGAGERAPPVMVFTEQDARGMLTRLPQRVRQGLTKPEADAAVKELTAAGAKAQTWIVPVGPDIARGWGRRRTVAEDFLFDYPVMPGEQRVGPDLANVGVRLPDPNWHLRHLYAPGTYEKASTMPPYRFLFEKRKVRQEPSPDALVLPPELAPEPGYEIVPKPAAIALAAYLTSLRADAPLYVAPLTVAPPAAPATNAPVASGATNAAPGAPAAK